MINLTNREKKLVYITFILCLIFGSYAFLLEPTIQSIQEKEALVTELSIEVDSYQLSFASITSLEAAYQNNLSELASLETLIGDYMQDEDVDRLVSAMLVDHYLTVSNFTLINNDADDYDINGAVAMAKSVQLTLSGDRDDFIDFVEVLYQRSDVVLTSLTMASDDEFEISFTIYMKAEQ